MELMQASPEFLDAVKAALPAALKSGGDLRKTYLPLAAQTATALKSVVPESGMFLDSKKFLRAGLTNMENAQAASQQLKSIGLGKKRRRGGGGAAPMNIPPAASGIASLASLFATSINNKMPDALKKDAELRKKDGLLDQAYDGLEAMINTVKAFPIPATQEANRAKFVGALETARSSIGSVDQVSDLIRDKVGAGLVRRPRTMSQKMRARNELVRKVMKDEGVSLGEASRMVKQMSK